MRVTLVLAALASLSAVAAQAQDYYPYRGRVVSERVIVERRAGPAYAVQPRFANQCVPWCPGDSNPCDPPAYKAADGRCQNDNY